MKMSLAKAIALAATLGTAASAQAAISVNPNGQGQVLLYPLYTVENGNDTAISVTNTTSEFKAVKVRFREALNSQDVLDFHVFLSPEDVWNGVVIATEDGAKLVTRDTSCTIPSIPAAGQPLSALAFTGQAVETAERGQDGGPQDLKRTRVGYVEIIELGVLDRNLPTSTKKADGTPVTFGEAIKHVNGVPGNCAALTNEYTNGKWKDGSGATKGAGDHTNEFTGFNYGFLDGVAAVEPGPTSAAPVSTYTLGGLYGVGTITNVFAGQQIGYDATAINGFILEPADATEAANPAMAGNLHNATGYSFPDLNGNRTPGTAVDVPEVGIGASKQATINGTTYDFNKAIDAVSAVLQRTELNNEFSVDSVVGAGTDWVVTFPTKHHYVWDSQIAADGKRATFNAAGAISGDVVNVPASGAYVGVDDGTGTMVPVADYPLANKGQGNVSPFHIDSLWKGVDGNASANVEVSFTKFDREEAREEPVPGGIDFSPRPVGAAPDKSYLRYEANVITFNNSNVLVGQDTYARNNFTIDAAKFKSGWVTLNFVQGAEGVVEGTDAGGATAPFSGLPAIGFATIKVTNGDLGGVLSNYNSAWNHKSN